MTNDELVGIVCSGLTPTSIVEIDRESREVTVTTQIVFDDLAEAERAADTLWTHTQDVAAAAAGWPV